MQTMFKYLSNSKWYFTLPTLAKDNPIDLKVLPPKTSKGTAEWWMNAHPAT